MRFFGFWRLKNCKIIILTGITPYLQLKLKKRIKIVPNALFTLNSPRVSLAFPSKSNVSFDPQSFSCSCNIGFDVKKSIELRK